MNTTAAPLPVLPEEPIHKLTRPMQRYLHIEAASGIVLLAATVAALAIANSPYGAGFHHFWQTPVALAVGEWRIEHSLEEWINDGLMVLFFFVIGMEVKYELVLGELREVRQAMLPMLAALGGMVVPAGIYIALRRGQPGAAGWGIPMATDIAFVVGCMAILGKRVPHGLRVMLLTLAIADDIGAILVIAFGYSTGISLPALAWAAVGLAFVHVLARLGVRDFLPYVVLGVLVWAAFLVSGVHATIAGVVLGLMTPARNYIGPEHFHRFLEFAGDLIDGPEWGDARGRVERVQALRQATRETISPLVFLQSVLHPWVSFVIMPLFAFANAGVAFRLSDVSSGVSIATALGLIVGKPVGILLFSALAIGAGLARLPEEVSWRKLAGGACLGGIGFTMALFIASLALDGALLDQAKLGVLAGSLASALLGIVLLLGPPAAAPK